MRIGYARVSTRDQHPEVQAERLLAAGCDPEMIFTDHGASGAKASRPAWDACRAKLRKGDVLVTVRLDRIGRSVANLLAVMTELGDQGVDLVCLDQPVDTTTPIGKMLFTILAAVAEFERDLIIERTRDGLAASPARGRNGGRKGRLSDDQQAAVRSMRTAGMSIAQIGQALAVPTKPGGPPVPVSRQTVYRALGNISR